MARIKFSTCSYETLAGGAISLCRDGFGEKVLELPDGRIIKLFRSKRFFSSNTLFPYAKRFARVARELARRGIPTVEVVGLYRLPDVSRQAVVYRKIEGETLRSTLARAPTPHFLLARLAEFMASLHNKGVYFRSLHFTNLVCRPPDSLALIDILDTKLWPGPLWPGLRARNFRHLIRYQVDREALAAFGVERFLHCYLTTAALPPRHQTRFLRRLARVDRFYAECGDRLARGVAPTTAAPLRSSPAQPGSGRTSRTGVS
jgi:hypothetical protein